MRGGVIRSRPASFAQGSLVRRQRHLDAALDVFGRPGRRRHDVEVEDLGRQPQRGAGVGDVDDAGDMALHGAVPRIE